MDYERIKRLYREGKLTEAGLDRAVAFGWITADQKQEIMEANNEDN